MQTSDEVENSIFWNYGYLYMISTIKELPYWFKLIVFAVVPTTYTAFFSHVLFIVDISKVPNSNYAFHTATEDIVWAFC